MFGIWRTVLSAMSRISLMPLTVPVTKVYVVPERLLDGTCQIGLLLGEPFACPVFVEGHLFSHLHDIHKTPSPVLRLASYTDNPIAYHRCASDLWLASRQRTRSKERIRSKPVVPPNYVREESHTQN
jgi:hypothetical protein